MASLPIDNLPLRESLKVQWRVLYALLIREILTRYGRHNIGFLWLFVEPMIFTLGVTALWTATKSAHGSSLPIVAFALTGYSSVLLWRNMPGRCIGALWVNLSLLYHRNIKVLDIYLARLLLEFGGATISFATLSVVFISIGWLSPPEDFLKVVAGWLVIAWFGAALAITLGALSHLSELVDKLWHPASYLIFPFRAPGSWYRPFRRLRRMSCYGSPWSTEWSWCGRGISVRRRMPSMIYPMSFPSALSSAWQR